MDTITTAKLKKLLALGDAALHELAEKDIVVRGDKRGTYMLEASVRGYARICVKSRLDAAAKMPLPHAHGWDRRKRAWQKRRPGSFGASLSKLPRSRSCAHRSSRRSVLAFSVSATACARCRCANTSR
jgi:hypothetical protein